MTIQELVNKQREYYKSGKTNDVNFRLSQLKKLRNAILNNRNNIEEALNKDLHKTNFESYMTEIGMVLDDLGFAIKHLKKWMKPNKVKTPLAQFPSKSFTVSEPYGVVLIMSPWNYPFNLCIEPLIGAISGGNTVIVKPSAYSPNISKVISNIIEENFPPEYITTVLGGRAENQELLEQKFDYIFFTGSVNVGKIVMEKASHNLTPISLELGGKSPVIVDSTANLEIAARRIAFGKYLNAGQTCVAPDYLLIERSVKEDFVKLLIKNIKSFYPNDNYEQMPHIINERHFNRLLALIGNEKIIFGGNNKIEEKFIQPTVLDNINFESPVMQEEIFGPILPIICFDDIYWAVEQIVSRPKPLALYLFSSSKEIQKLFLEKVSFGGGCINDTIIHLATPHMGFGGVGDSGMGSYHGKKSFETFTHEKSIVKKSTWLDINIRYLPYNSKKLKKLEKFLK